VDALYKELGMWSERVLGRALQVKRGR